MDSSEKDRTASISAHIQVVSPSSLKDEQEWPEDPSVRYAALSKPVAFANFNVTVVSLQDERIWRSKSTSSYSIDCENDIKTLSAQVGTSDSTTLVLLPQDYLHFWDENPNNKGYYHQAKLKDCPELLEKIVSELTGMNVSFISGVDTTVLSGNQYESDFDITKNPKGGDFEVVCKGSSGQVTVCKQGDVYLSTIAIPSLDGLHDMLWEIGIEDRAEETYPEWLDVVPYHGEGELRSKLEATEDEIRRLQDSLGEIEGKLEDNRRAKSIVCSKDAALQTQVVGMLQEMLGDDEPFEDIFEEDYRYETEDTAFLFEVKGSSKSLKRSHVSSCDHHVQMYYDAFDEGEEHPSAKGILVFAEEIETPPDEHAPYVNEQIALAKHYGVLIVPAVVFLQLYQSVIFGESSKGEFLGILKSKKGLLKASDIKP